MSRQELMFEIQEIKEKLRGDLTKEEMLRYVDLIISLQQSLIFVLLKERE